MKIETAQKILEKTKQDYEQLAEEFSDTRINLWPELQELAKYIKGGDKILDLGCGNGRLFELLKNRPVEYAGVDSCQKLIELARIQYPVSSIENPKFVVADATDLPFKGNELDVIFAIALLHHIPSEELRLKVLKNCYRVLRHGGLLILTVWNLWQPKLLWRYKIWPMIFGWRPKKLNWKDVFIPWKAHGGTVYRYYHAFCKNELKNLIQRANFEIIDSYYVRKGQKVNWLNGFNLIVIAKKPKI